MKKLENDVCFRRKDYFKAYRVTKDNARDLLDLIGYSPSRIESRNIYRDDAYARITEEGIEFGSRFSHNSARFGDYILDYDGKRLWPIYTPEEFEKEFCIWPST